MDVTDNTPVLPELPNQIPAQEQIASVSADSAYFTKAGRENIALRKTHAVVPAQKRQALENESSWHGGAQ